AYNRSKFRKIRQETLTIDNICPVNRQNRIETKSSFTSSGSFHSSKRRYDFAPHHKLSDRTVESVDVDNSLGAYSMPPKSLEDSVRIMVGPPADVSSAQRTGVSNHPFVQLRAPSPPPHHGLALRVYKVPSSLDKSEFNRNKMHDAHEQSAIRESQRAVNRNELCEQRPSRHDSNKLYEKVPRVHRDSVERSNSVNCLREDNDFHALPYQTRSRYTIENGSFNERRSRDMSPSVFDRCYDEETMIKDGPHHYSFRSDAGVKKRTSNISNEMRRNECSSLCRTSGDAYTHRAAFDRNSDSYPDEHWSGRGYPNNSERSGFSSIRTSGDAYTHRAAFDRNSDSYPDEHWSGRGYPNNSERSGFSSIRTSGDAYTHRAAFDRNSDSYPDEHWSGRGYPNNSERSGFSSIRTSGDAYTHRAAFDRNSDSYPDEHWSGRGYPNNSERSGFSSIRTSGDAYTHRAAFDRNSDSYPDEHWSGRGYPNNSERSGFSSIRTSGDAYTHRAAFDRNSDSYPDEHWSGRGYPNNSERSGFSSIRTSGDAYTHRAAFIETVILIQTSTGVVVVIQTIQNEGEA
ncbi:hypothetical protein KIN20_012386, partial [Parelaphostrongylus tenuis]